MQDSENKTLNKNGPKISLHSKIMDALVYLAHQHSLSLAIIVLMGSGLILTNLYLLSSKLNKSTALQNAQVISDAIRHFRNLSIAESGFTENYSKDDSRVKQGSRRMVNSWHSNLNIKIGKALDMSALDAETRFFSRLPFGLSESFASGDPFEEEALEFLKENHNKSYTRFEEYGGRWSLRYAVAETMRPNCINCHNHNRQSPDKAWKVNDFVGVLEVIVPLDKVKKTVQSDLLGSFLFMTTITILGLAFLTLVISGLRRSTIEATMLAKKTKGMNVELQEEIRERSKIESDLADRTAESENMNHQLHQEIRDRKNALAESETIRKELEEFNKVAVGRELKMLEMKKRINELLKELGKDEYYKVDN